MQAPLVWIHLIAAATLALSAAAFAAPMSGAAIESSVARFILGETAEGVEMMGRFLGRRASSADVDEFLRGIREAGPGYSHVRQDLEFRIGRMREGLQRARIARNGGRKLSESSRLAPEEQLVLREAAKQEFSLNEVASTGEAQPGKIRFAESERAGLEADREEFLNPLAEGDEALRIKAEPLEKAPEFVQRETRRGLKEWASDAQACLENRPAQIAKAAEKRDLLQQLSITAAVNTGAYLFTTGVSHFDPGSFSVDMLISMLSTTVSMSWMKSADSFRVRWLKVYSWGRLRTRLDAELYQVIPWTNTHGVPMADAVREREEFNRSWSAQTSIINPIMFTVLSGAECLIGERSGVGAAKSFARGAFAVKFGVGVGMSFLYYKVRANNLHSTGETH